MSLVIIYIASIGIAAILPVLLTVVTSLIKQKKVNRLLSIELDFYNYELNMLHFKYIDMKKKLEKLSDKPGNGNPNPPPPPP